jgi:hypothetical protein
MDYLRFQSSACPISKFAKAVSGCAPHSRIAVSISRFAASPSRSRRPTEGIRPLRLANRVGHSCGERPDSGRGAAASRVRRGVVIDWCTAPNARRVRHGLRRGASICGGQGRRLRSKAGPSASPIPACPKSICPWGVRRMRRWSRVSMYSGRLICRLCVHTLAVRSTAVLRLSGARRPIPRCAGARRSPISSM